MTVRKLDDSGDIVTSGQQFLPTGGAEELAQNIRTRMALYTDEWFLNYNDGTPWLPNDTRLGILGKGGMTLSTKEALIRRRILLSPGCVGMSSFSVNYDLSTRRLSVQSSTISQSGDTAQTNFVQAIF